MLPFVGQFSEDAKALRSIVLASAAFPVAFSPQPIEYCVAGEGGPSSSGICTEPTHVDLFVDGGVFDNNPLGIAYRTALAGLTDGPDVKLRDHVDGKNPSHADVYYGYIDPDLRTYPLYTPKAADEQPDEDPVVSLITRMGGQMLADARGHELASLADENIDLMEGLWIVRGNYPPISEMLSAFFGFFERDFRDFDFQLGMYDSFVDLRDKSSVRLGTEKYIQQLDALLQGDAQKVPDRYRKLACIASQVGEKRYRHQASACGGQELRNFRVLLQIAIDRLWSNCRMLSSEQVALSSHMGCKQARGGLPPPIVDPSFAVEGARYKVATESDFDYAIRLFGDYQFHFRDLGLSPTEGKRARVTVRRKLIAMVEALSAAQGSYLNRTAVMTAGRTLINSIYY
ncbi:MAG TPA: patatin-like phospholipase family protein, partial [Polyangiaceae bacterium]|nr:patatin-like phospholipase family protein [Polyangiaceae bacterium]